MITAIDRPSDWTNGWTGQDWVWLFLVSLGVVILLYVVVRAAVGEALRSHRAALAEQESVRPPT